MTTRLLCSVAAALLAGCAAPPARQGCGDEHFEAFLPRYMVDRPFATERTMFPLETLRAEEDGRRKSLVSREEFAHSTLLADVIKKDKLSTAQAVTPGAAELHVFMPDSDALVYFYRFRQHNGCWYLWQFEDASL